MSADTPTVFLCLSPAMTSQRVADAARVSPYPFVVHQVPSSPPGNGDRSQPTKGKKKPKPRAERANQEEESRFNIGPVRPGNYGIRRNSRQPGRSLVDDRSRIPDYPPPSFQEATSESGLSSSPSSTSLTHATVTASTLSIAGDPLEQPVREPTTTRAARKEIDPIKEEEEDSQAISDAEDCGMVIVNKHEIPVSSADLPPTKQERYKMDWLKRRKPDPPAVSTTNVGEQPRGRKNSRPTLRINPAFDATDPTPPEVPVTSPKRRFFSLSPIRTIFPPRTTGHQERSSVSANVSPVSSPKTPLVASRNFLRSTHSLSPASILKPAGASPSTGQKKESLSRRLFSHKGKERAKDLVVSESFDDNWEVVETPPPESENHPQSLLSAVESLSLNGSTTTLLSRGSPTTNKHVKHKSAENVVADKKTSTSSLDGITGSSSSSSSSSAEDEIRPDNQPSTVDATSPPQNETSESPPTSPTVVANTPTSSSPVTQPLNLPIDSQPQPAPHVPASPSPVVGQPILTGDPRAADKDVFKHALQIPLPMTPVYQNWTGSTSAADVSKERLLPPLVPVTIWRSPGAARSTPDFLQERYRTSSPGPVSSCSCRTNVNPSFKYIPSPLSASVFPSYPKATLTPQHVSAREVYEEEQSTPSKHYTGRPLPCPPPRTKSNPVFNLKGGLVSSASLAGSQAEPQDGKGGTEGLLIDLEDTSLDSNLSPTTTNSDESGYQSQVYLPVVTNSPTSVEFAHEPSVTTPMELMDLSFTSSSMQATSTVIPPVSASPTHVTSFAHHHPHHHSLHHHPHHHHQIQRHQTTPQQFAGFLKSNNLDLPVRYCDDGLHCELNSSYHQHQFHPHPHLQEDGSWPCQPASPSHPHPPPPSSSSSLWRAAPVPAPALPPLGVYQQPQHYHQHHHLPMDAAQRQRHHHIAHLSY